MLNPPKAETQVYNVKSLHDLISTPFSGEKNAMCWKRSLTGDFSEIVHKITFKENITTINEKELLDLQLTEQGSFAREVLLSDLKALENHGAAPTLNLIKNYDKDDTCSFFPTDVYSFHVDRSPVPTDTFLCTYYGESSEILPNSQGKQKILIPEVRAELRKIYNGNEDGFDAFLSEYFFDLHYQANADATPFSLGNGHIWKLATDHPGNSVKPCLHRAPVEKDGQTRLLLIC